MLVVPVSVMGLAILARFAGSPTGRSLDEKLLNSLDQQSGNGLLLGFANRVDGFDGIILVAWSLCLLVVAARCSERRLIGLVMVAFVLCAVGASELLKTLVIVRHLRLGATLPTSLNHTWPSTHAAAAASLALATVAMFPTRRSAIAAVGAAGVMSLCLLMTAAHFPSDVLAGWLIAGCAVASAITIVSLLSTGKPTGPG